jgi:hypothetical protein
MPTTYFSNFNTVQYSNTSAIDITERVVLGNTSVLNTFIYYPTELNYNIRSDNLAYNAYGDPYASWVLYLTNNIIDPYYDWYLTDDQFSSFVDCKYGSVPLAQQKVKYFINDWTGQSDISPAGYNALTSNQKTYWYPNIDYNFNPFSYSRKQVDWKISTNFVININTTSNSQFIADELVQIQVSYTNSNNSYNAVGQGQVISTYQNNIIIQHITSANSFIPTDNTYSINTNSSYCYGVESGSNVNIISTNFISNNIPIDTYVYWAPVYYYDYENEINEGNKIINILLPQYLNTFVKGVNTLLAASKSGV